MSLINNPENSLPYHLRGTFRGYEIALGRYLKQFNLPVSQFYILRLQWSAGGNSQKEISGLAYMSESVASQVIKKMVDADLVRRRSDSQDSRAKIVFLTDKGKALRERIAKEGIQISNENAPQISRKDMKTAIRVLKSVREGFDLYNTK